MRLTRTLAALAAASIGMAGLAAATATGAAEQATGARDIVLVVDSTGLTQEQWLVQKRTYLAMLDDRASFPLDGSVAVSFVQYGAAAGGGQASRVTVPLTRLDSEGALGKVTASILAATLVAPEKAGVDGLSAAAQELKARGTTGSTRSVCATANAPWDSDTLAKGSSATKSEGVSRQGFLALSGKALSPTQAQQSFGSAIWGGSVVVSARNVPQLSTLVGPACLLPQVRLEAIEVNQVIQDWENSVPLAEYKDTIVRVYLETLVTFGSATATGLLHGERGGVPLSNSPLSPINTGGTTTIDGDIDNESDRESQDASLNFDLPTSWLTGDVTLTFESPSTMTCSGAAGDATDCDVDVTFEENAEPEVDYVSVPYEFMGSLQEPTDAAMVEIMYRTEDIFPVQHIDFDFDWLPWNAADDTVPNLGLVNGYLVLLGAYEGCLPACSQYFYGVLSGYGGGLANGIPGTVASGFVDGTSTTGAYGYARNRGPHEIAHMVGAHHIVNAAENGWKSTSVKNGWCGEEGGSAAPEYPYWFYSASKSKDVPSLGPTGTADEEIWGVAPRFWNVDSNLAVTNPFEVFPLMGYCKAVDTSSQYRWPSTQTYEVLADEYLDTRAATTRASKPVDMIVVRGIVNPEDFSDTRFLPVLPVTAPAPSAQDGDWTIRLLDRRGKPLASRAFEMSENHGDATEPEAGEPEESLQFLVPFPASVASRIGTIQLVKDAKVVSSAKASATAPTVSVSSPKVGSAITGDNVTITWSSRDRDSQELTATVLYRPNAQATWKPVAIDVPGTSAQVPRSALAGSRTGEFLVIASDGVRFAAKRVGPVRVADNAPILSLQQAEGNVVAAQNFALDAVAWDREDGVLDRQITWTSSLDGRLGQGRRLDLVASDLSEGVHTITVRAMDSAKHLVTDTMTIEVSRVAEQVKVTRQ